MNEWMSAEMGIICSRVDVCVYVGAGVCMYAKDIQSG